MERYTKEREQQAKEQTQLEDRYAKGKFKLTLTSSEVVSTTSSNVAITPIDSIENINFSVAHATHTVAITELVPEYALCAVAQELQVLINFVVVQHCQLSIAGGIQF